MPSRDHAGPPRTTCVGTTAFVERPSQSLNPAWHPQLADLEGLALQRVLCLLLALLPPLVLLRTHQVVNKFSGCAKSPTCCAVQPGQVLRHCCNPQPALTWATDSSARRISTASKNLGTSPALRFIERKFGTGLDMSSKVRGLWNLSSGCMQEAS